MPQENLEQKMYHGNSDANQNSGSDLRYANQPLETRLASMDKDLAEISSAIDSLDGPLIEPSERQIRYMTLKNTCRMIGNGAYKTLKLLANSLWLPTYARTRKYNLLVDNGESPDEEESLINDMILALIGLSLSLPLTIPVSHYLVSEPSFGRFVFSFLGFGTNTLSSIYEHLRRKTISKYQKKEGNKSKYEGI